MKELIQSLKKPLLQMLVTVFVTIAVLCCIAAAPAARDYVMSTLSVWPAASENGTNSVIFRDKTGTNWIRVSPTNANFETRWQGTNFTAILRTNLFLTNGGVAYPVKIRNGLWVE